MKANASSKAKNKVPAALKALRRAAKKAVEMARLTGTHAYILEEGRIVDAAKPTRKARKMHGQA
jgi:hypothetical protein